MSRDKIRQEIAEYLNKEPNLFRSDRQAALERILDRQISERGTAHAINRIDLLQMISNASSHMATMTMPCHISKKRLNNQDCNHVAMIEAVLGYLNRNGLLIKQVAFDYTSGEYDFESIDDL